MKPFEFYDEASAELDDALELSAARSKRLAAEFRECVDEHIRDICSGLITGPKYPGTVCRELRVDRFPYNLVYLDDSDAIRIVAFAHHKRRPGYWKSRLPRN